MNKIVLVGEKVLESLLDGNIEFTNNEKGELFTVNNLFIKVIKDCELEIYFNGDQNYKININISINPNVTLKMFEKIEGSKAKIQYKYDLSENSYLNLNKFHDCEAIKEQNIINLNGQHATVDYTLKTISKSKEDYNIIVYHNADYTNSDIKNEGVNIQDGELKFNLTSTVFDNIIGCRINQAGQIINLTNNQCFVNPNLLIENNDVEANHSAAIGRFNDEEIFYLMSRGIDYNNAINLLIKGFLIGNMSIDDAKLEEIKIIIDKYWR